tara:strand:- start:199 stop:393 length:195 start_codon:yes stop_codon:yes gene_type:complete
MSYQRKQKDKMIKNHIAKDLRTPKYKQRVVGSKKKYSRLNSTDIHNKYIKDTDNESKRYTRDDD